MISNKLKNALLLAERSQSLTPAQRQHGAELAARLIAAEAKQPCFGCEDADFFIFPDDNLWEWELTRCGKFIEFAKDAQGGNIVHPHFFCTGKNAGEGGGNGK